MIFTQERNILNNTLLDEFPVVIDGYEFRAYPFVNDYPFSLKTACKLDYRGWPRPFCSRSIDVSEKGFFEIDNADTYFANKSTIEEDLEKISLLNKNVVMATHMPPNGLDLDVCRDFRRVGSKAVYDWVKREQPLILLTGHIHESPEMTGTWKNNLEKTLIIQPGQAGLKTTLVLIEIDDNKNIRAERIII